MRLVRPEEPSNRPYGFSHSDAESDNYDDLIYNYSIDSDPLSEAVWSGAAVRVGCDIPELDYEDSDSKC